MPIRVLAILLATLLFPSCEPREAGSPAPEASNPEILSAADPGAEAGARRGVPGGRWRRALLAEGDSVSPEQQEKIDELHAIGYLAGSVAAGAETGVVVHVPEKVSPRLNFYTSGHGPEAVLMDMDGKVLHTWRHEFREIWPEYPGAYNEISTQFFRRAHLFPNGEIVVLFEGLGILKLDRESNLLWAVANRAHHDLDVLPNGDIYVLTREAHVVPRVNTTEPILEDFLSVLDGHGVEKKRVSLLSVFEDSDPKHSWARASLRFWTKEKTRQLADSRSDIFHTNSIEVLDGRAAAAAPAFRQGNVLVSLCHLDMVAVIDLEQEKVVWSLPGLFSLQHDPTITREGHLIVFDNHWRQGRSSVTALHPATLRLQWQYYGVPGKPFFSDSCGAISILPNGNVLITESDNGRALEVTPAKEVVWEFTNPHRAGANEEYIATLFEVVRLPPDFPLEWTRESP